MDLAANASDSGRNTPNGTTKQKTEHGGVEGPKSYRRRYRGPKPNRGTRRNSVSKPARDPRDEASPVEGEESPGAGSLSRVIDFDGLSRPSKSPSTPPLHVLTLS
jgi:GTP cyclohydrolase I